ncbi:MAG: hypothetical protein DWQ10_10820 [Calditrichaeota bacterium]|nr:MAG: hypothetical protein DWQ10_10820 [Calditrichota bacterium]
MPVQNRKVQLFVWILCVNSIFISCSNDGPTKENSGGDLSILMPLEGEVQNIQLAANQDVQFTLTLQIPPEIKMIESATLNVQETLKHASVSYQGSAGKAALLGAIFQNEATGSILVRVDDSPETACASAITYGPYDLAPGFFSSPDPEEILLDQPSIQLVNRGTVALCLIMHSSVDATVSIDEVAVDMVQSDCPDVADFSGMWTGTYQCGNSCGPGFGGSITLTISQDGASATYVDDGEYSYTGTVCGDVFRFERIDEYEKESGTLTLIDANSAVKRSTWRSRSEPTCFGNCVDSLYRVSN